MKIKRDYVTNSSSTSFIIAFKGDFNESQVLKAFGVERGSILARFLESFLYNIQHDISPAREYYQKFGDCSFEEFVSERFGEDTLNKINEMETSGMKVYMGKLSSDESLMEVLLCTECFLVEEKEFYFNGKNNAW